MSLYNISISTYVHRLKQENQVKYREECRFLLFVLIHIYIFVLSNSFNIFCSNFYSINACGT